MSSVAVIGAVVAAGSAVYSSQQQKKAAAKAAAATPDAYNAYGELNTPSEGAIKSRDSIFDAVNSDAFQTQSKSLSAQYLKALQNAAADQHTQQISDYASSTLRGDYLQSPQITNMAQGASDQIMAGAADNAARLQAQYARGGTGFSTGMLRGLQANQTAAAAQAARTKANILGQNYQFERGLQQSAAPLLAGAVAAPATYYAQMSDALYQPYQSQAGLTTQLLGGGQQLSPKTMLQTPTLAQNIGTGVKTAQGIYDLYQNFKQPQSTSSNANLMASNYGDYMTG